MVLVVLDDFQGDIFADAETCCGEIHCNNIEGFSCAANVGPGFSPREVKWFQEGLERHRVHCKGESDCHNRCCQGTCDSVTCTGDYICKRPYPPEKCTLSTCQEQCCYDSSYCGNGLNAWTSACNTCQDLLPYCESQLGIERDSVSRHQWNHAVIQAVKAGTLEPGCEEELIEDCRSNLDFFVVSSFHSHHSKEGRSVNSVAVVPGGIEALSGGDDAQVFMWKIADGSFTRNFSEHTARVLQITPLNDAAYFCAATPKEAIMWLTHGLHGEDAIGMEYRSEERRKHHGACTVTGCIGLASWETALIGQNNSFVSMWEWKGKHQMYVPVDPKLAYEWQVKKDVGYYEHWPVWDRDNVIKNEYVKWMLDRYRLRDGYVRRLRGRQLEDSGSEEEENEYPWWLPLAEKKLHRAGPSAPWTNTFTNLRWGDVPNFYYEPNGWGAVTSMAEIVSDTLFAVGYEDGSIRVWRTYNGFIVAVISKAHAGSVAALVSAPAGNMLYSGGDDGWIRIWEASTGKPLGAIYAAFAGPILAMDIIPGGSALYSAHASGRFILWELGTRSALCQLDAEGGKINSLVVNPGVVGQLVVALEKGEARVYSMR
ncbi:unnamed protein product [Effrenium voratum]|nr:unnamed protein product [Effrenium voratum]